VSTDRDLFSPTAQFESQTDEVGGSFKPKFALNRAAGIRNRLVGHAQGLGNGRQALTFSQQPQNTTSRVESCCKGSSAPYWAKANWAAISHSM
jgi:hypothetical protein